MLKHRVYIRKTKRGKILKVVREHYLRDDLWCGSQACGECQQETAVLDELPAVCSTLCNYPHYVIVDTNVVLDQVDVLESDALKNVILLQTVLEEVRNKSSPIYKRIRDVAQNSSRKFHVFINEHHKDTYIERKGGESVSDRNDRAIRTTALWYKSHLDKIKKPVTVVLLTDDVQNKKYAEEAGIVSYSISDYVRSLTEYPGLEDKLSKRTFTSEGKTPIYPEHLTTSHIHEGIKLGKLHQGTFQASRDNYLEGFVNVEGVEKSVLIQGQVNLNRAVDGDTVAIQLFQEEKWSAPSEIVLEDREFDPGDMVTKDEEEIRKYRDNAIEKRPTGRVVGIIRRKWRQYCGIIQKNPVAGMTHHLFIPAEKKVPKIRIESRQGDVLATQKIIVAIDSWPRTSRYPQGHFVRALGAIGDKATENEVLLLEHDVPHSKFSEAVLACLPKLPWIITEEDTKERRDLRHLDICSVDPPGCTDIDDALHCRELGNGNYEVGVHIADVSHFIRPGTAIDKEASLRGTTVYLVDKRIDMVPELLSSNLCSLRGGEERFAFSAIWELNNDAQIVKTEFCKSIIRSRNAFTYAEAQLKIDDHTQQDEIAKSLRNLNKLAKILKKRRIANGALVLASPEIRFMVDSETHDPIDVEVKQLKETNSMVEEFMLLANISVAEKISQVFPECAVLRRHPEPPLANFEPLIKAGSARDCTIDVSSGKALADSLDAAVKPGNPYFNTMLRILATRCMMQAVYFSTGMEEKENYKHFGLAVPIYTHFTSPIRRYADIMVHRLLGVTIGAHETYAELLDKHNAQNVCNNLNYRNRMAQYAGRASVALHTHIFFKNKVLDEEGYVLYVRQNALQVLIPKYGIEGTVFLNPKEGEKSAIEFVFNQQEPSQTCGDVVFRTFDPVIVQLSLDEANTQHVKLVLKLVYPEILGFSVPSLDSTQEPEKKKSKAK